MKHESLNIIANLLPVLLSFAHAFADHVSAQLLTYPKIKYCGLFELAGRDWPRGSTSPGIMHLNISGAFLPRSFGSGKH